jgi:YfiH family protein
VSVGWLEADWPAPAGVRVISTFRGGGASAARFESLNLGDRVGDDLAAVAENRARLMREAQLPSEPRWLTQVHGVAVRNLDVEEAPGAAHAAPGAAHAEPGAAHAAPGAADAAFTRQPGRVCVILSADCLPVLFAAESGEVVGAAHAGWRGLASGIIEATVGAMGVLPERLLAWLGPGIGPKHFEVGAEVRQAFLDRDAGAHEAFSQNSRGRFMADLGLLARRRLGTLGIRRIHGGDECTYTSADRYFSHRRDGNTGRQATLIWREQR